jgi:hypothetical protein
LVNFQNCLQTVPKHFSQSFKILTAMWYAFFLSFDQIFKCVFIVYSRLTVTTLKNSRTEIFSGLIFSFEHGVLLSIGNRNKLQLAISGGKGRFRITTIFFCFRCYCTMADFFDKALSCNNLTLLRDVAGWLFFFLIFR